jgi:hypothetical protein
LLVSVTNVPNRQRKLSLMEADTTSISPVNPFALIVTECLVKLKVPMEEKLIDLLMVNVHQNKRTNEMLYKMQQEILSHSSQLNKMQI